ncbi:MAG: DUF2970 domain-containing protein [Rhizobacter sp.]|nr:DUF2970 domain-containing protein [Burkholderiales bacterium]
MNQPTNHLRCVLYAMRTIVRVLPALGSDKDHLHPPPGMSFKHFVVGGVISAVLLVSSLLMVVSIVISFVVAK